MSKVTEGILFANRYKLLKPIGQGGFSEVWQAEDVKAEGLIIAIKIYAPNKGLDEEGINIFKREFALTTNLQHSNLLPVRYYDTFEGSPYLILPYCKKGSLRKRLVYEGPLSENELLRIIKEVGAALEYLHKQKILHQDIKPDNILIDDMNRYMLTDFGISHARETIQRVTGVKIEGLTISYAPPEMFGAVQKQTEKGDIFSFGVMLYELATGDIPWGGIGGLVLGKGAEIPQLPDTFSKLFKEIVNKCLQKEVEDRPTAGELVKLVEREESKTPDRYDSTERKVRETKEDMSKDETQQVNKKKILIWTLTVLVSILIIVLIYFLFFQVPIREETPVSDQKHIDSTKISSSDHNKENIDYSKELSYKICDYLNGIRTPRIIESSPIILNGTAYFSGVDRTIYAIDINTQNVKWKFQVKGAISTRPVIEKGTLYFGCDDGNVYAIDIVASKGSKNAKWLFTTNASIKSTPIIHRENLIFGCDDKCLYSVNIDSKGKEYWKFKTGDMITSNPIIFNSEIYFGSWDGFLYAVGNTPIKMKIKELSTIELNKIQNDPTIGFIPEGKDYLFHFKTKKFKTEGPIKSSAVFSEEGIVYFGSSDGNIYALEAKTFKELWRKPGIHEYSSPFYLGGMVFFGSSDSKFYALNAKTGDVRNIYHTISTIISYPAALDGKIYFGDGIGNFYSLDTNSIDRLNLHFKTQGPISGYMNVYENQIYFGRGDSIYFVR